MFCGLRNSSSERKEARTRSRPETHRYRAIEKTHGERQILSTKAWREPFGFGLVTWHPEKGTPDAPRLLPPDPELEGNRLNNPGSQ